MSKKSGKCLLHKYYTIIKGVRKLYYNLPPDITPDEILEYLRKSRSDDPTLSVDEVLEKHETQLNEWAERHLGRAIPEKNKFREIGSGESIESRPEMQKVLKMIESPKIRAVLVKETSRLGRPSLKEIGILSELFQYSNTLIITPERVFDLRNKYDRDAFEREMMRGAEYLEYFKEIQQNGRLASVAAGNYIGSIAPYGYDKIWVMDGKKKCPTLKIREDEATVVRMMYDMFVNQNLGLYNIAKKFNDELKIKPRNVDYWTGDTIREILSNVHNIGKVRWNWRKTVTIVENGEVVKTRPKTKIGEYLVFDGRHEAIVSEEIFNATLEKLGNNPRTKSTVKLRNAFAGLLYCQCGRAMTLRMHGSGNNKKAEPRLLCLNQSHCGTGSCKYDDVLERICEILQQCIEDFEIRLKNDTGDSAKLHAKLIKNLEKQMGDIKARELSQWEQQSHPDPSQRMPAEIFKQLNERLLQEKAEVQEALCKAYASMPEPVDYEEKIAKFKDALAALKNPDADAVEKNDLLKACIERIDYKREKPQRVKSQLVQYYDKDEKKTKRKSPLPVGGNWTNPPIEIDVKLKV